MQNAQTFQETLRAMRDSRQWTLRQAADAMNEYDSSLHLSFGTLHHIETDGTYNIKIIRAMAAVYGRDLADVEAAATDQRIQLKKSTKEPVLS